MTSPTRGPNKGHSRRAISPDRVRALMSLRRRGMTCAEIAKTLGIGESTVARYSGAWWQSEGSKKFHRQKKRAGSQSRKRVTESNKKVPVAVPTTNAELTSEQIEYINEIYRSGDLNTGTFVGNLLIRIGKFFGGHNPV